MSGPTVPGTQHRFASTADHVDNDEMHAARRQAAFRLRQAAQWLMAAHPHGQAIERRPLNFRDTGALIRFDPPGVLRVFDWHDGLLLAESVVGAPGELSPEFVAPTGRL